MEQMIPEYEIRETTILTLSRGGIKQVMATPDEPARIRVSCIPNYKWYPMNKAAIDKLTTFRDEKEQELKELMTENPSAKRQTFSQAEVIRVINRNLDHYRGIREPEVEEQVEVVSEPASEGKSTEVMRAVDEGFDNVGQVISDDNPEPQAGPGAKYDEPMTFKQVRDAPKRGRRL